MRKENKSDKRAAIGIVMAISGLAVMTACGFLYANRAYAKETLQGIIKVVEETTQTDADGKFTNPFVILEIIPDFVEETYEVQGKEFDETTGQFVDAAKSVANFPINTGSVGYYIKGQEPTTQNLQKLFGEQEDGSYTVFTDSVSRKEIAGKMLDRSTGLGYLVDQKPNEETNFVLYDDTPAGYKELRLGEVTQQQILSNAGTIETLGDPYAHDCDGDKTAEEYTEATPELMEQLVGDQTFFPLPQDYEGSDGQDAYIDVAEGLMQRVPAEVSEGRNYVLTYEPKLNADGTLDTGSDAAYLFVNGGTGDAFQKSPLEGEYDPCLVYAGASGTHRAAFAYVEGAVSSGYQITGNQRAYADENTGAGVKAGTPLYTRDDDGIFYFRGFAKIENGVLYADPGEAGDVVGLVFTGEGAEFKEYEPDEWPDQRSHTEADYDDAEDGSEDGSEDGAADDPGTEDGGDGDSAPADEPGGASDDGQNDEQKNDPADVQESASVLVSSLKITSWRSQDDDPAGQTETGSENGQESGSGDAAETGDGSEDDPDEGTEDGSDDKKDEDPEDGSEDGTEEDPGDGSEGESGEEPDSGSENDYDEEETEYYTVQFAYVSEYQGQKLYQVSYYDTEGSKEYIVNTDGTGAIVPNTNGTGVITINDTTSISSQLIFDYKPGEGTYQWTSEAWLQNVSGVTTGYYRIRGAQIYYSTGLCNRDFFKKHVFDREAEECDGLPIVVKTMRAKDVEPEDIAASKLLIFQRGEPLYGPANGKTPVPTYSVKDGRDIKYSVMKEIVWKVINEGYPVVSDYGMFSRDWDDTEYLSGANAADGGLSYAYFLTRILVLKNMESFYNSVLGPELELTTNPLLFAGGEPIRLGDYNNVNTSVYNVTYHNYPGGGFLNGDFIKAFSNTEGFDPVLIDIQNENIFRMASGKKERLTEIISQATVIRYIIAYAKQPDYEQKGSLHILELAPCASYTLQLTATDGGKTHTLNKITSITPDGDDKGKIATTKKLIDFKSGDVTLTQMTTSEFIGHVEDINARYDLIYIGSGTGPYRLANGAIVEMNHDSEGKTVYNDGSMNGLIYCNIGDQYATKDMNVKTDGNTENMRFSGNDITQEKRRALQEFVEAGFPVIVSDELVDRQTGTTGGERAAFTVNANTVDNSSYMYEFLNSNKKRENIFRLSEVQAPLLNMYLNVGRPRVKPLDNTKTAWAMEQVQRLEQDSSGNFRAVFEFTVENIGITSSTATYDFNLYIDINADGKFSRTNEIINQVTLEDLAGNPIATDEQGRYLMHSGGSYRAIYILSSSQRGVLPWKICVTQNGNDLKRADITGYYEIRDPNGEREKIHVLQIDTTTEEAEGYYTPSTWNMETTSKDPNTWFYKLLNDHTAVPFDVTIETIPGDLLTVDYTTEKLGAENALSGADKYNLQVDDYLAFFRNYDMLVIGYANTMNNPSDTILEAIKIYIEEGRSVLFSHDTTSSHTRDNGWGNGYNRILRGTVGLDRYNIYGKRNESSTFNQEIAYQPKTNRGSRVWEDQGGAYPVMLKKQNGSSYNFLKGMANGSTYEYYLRTDKANYAYDARYWQTRKVESINTGQITMYPYKLDQGAFNIATTHSQYWQLDFSRDEDMDGESDVVVWYTLSGADDAANELKGNPISERTCQDTYDVSPRDVRNNYYIYNMGNVTYTGVGDTDVMGASGTGAETINEIKLFINTLIASYQSGLHDPEVRIIDNYNPQSRDINSIYLSYDEQMRVIKDEKLDEEGIIDEKEDIYFIANTTSLVRTNTVRTYTMTADLYVELPSLEGAEQLQYKGKNVYGRRLPVESLHRLDADGTEIEIPARPDKSYEIESGVVYKATIPISGLRYYSDGKAIFDENDGPIPTEGVNARNSRRIFVQATETIRNNRSGAESNASAMDDVTAVRVHVFDMD